MASPRDPVHVVGEVLATRRAGAFRVLTLAAPGVPQRFRPGGFVALQAGPGRLTRRALWIHRVRESGPHGPTLDVVVEPRGPGTTWLAALSTGDRVAVTGPLGRPFSLPRDPVRCLLVGEGYAAAVLFTLAERLRERACQVSLLLGAADEPHLLAAREARRLAASVTVVTDDGSVGERGTVAGRLPALLDTWAPDVVYAAAGTATLRSVASATGERGTSCQVALEVPTPCGTGLCHGCVVPVRAGDGLAHVVRSCVEGPVLPADRVRWEELS